MSRYVIFPAFLFFILISVALASEGNPPQEETYTFPAGGAQDLLHLKKIPSHLQADKNTSSVSIQTSCKNAQGTVIQSDQPGFENCLKEDRKK